MPEKIFFQSSLPRSGSTVFQNLLCQHPDFYCTPTSGTLELIFAARKNYSDSPEFKAQDKDLMKKAFLNFCKQGMLGYFDAITDKKYVLDKSRGWTIHYDFVKEILGEEPKMICVVRDLRDIACSMEKKIRNNPDKHHDIINWSNMSGTTTEKRMDIWFNSPPLGLALERLHQVILEEKDRNIHFVRYEDLCLYPEKEMERVYNYLGIDYFEHDFDSIEQVTQEDDDVYGVLGDHKIRKKLEMLKSDAESVLGKGVCKWIRENPSFQWYFQKFNYK